MPRYLLPLIALLAVALFALSCNGDGGGPGISLTPTGGTPTSQPGETVGPAETPAGDGETPAGESPGTEPEGTPGGPVGEGTPIVPPADQTAFFAQYSGATIDEESCPFDPRTAEVDCAARGIYIVDPPPGGEDVSCYVLIVDNSPIAVRCNSQEPLTSIYYEIKG